MFNVFVLCILCKVIGVLIAVIPRVSISSVAEAYIYRFFCLIQYVSHFHWQLVMAAYFV